VEAGGRIAPAIIGQAATPIFLANPRARARGYREELGLTEQEFNMEGSDNPAAWLPASGRPEGLSALLFGALAAGQPAVSSGKN
jgi:hypothetical protein